MINIPTIIDERLDFQISNRLKEFRNRLGIADAMRPSEFDFKFEKDKKLVRKISENLKEIFELQQVLVKRIKDNPQKSKGKVKRIKKRK